MFSLTLLLLHPAFHMFFFHFQPGQFQVSDTVCISAPASPPPILNTHTNIRLPPRERPASRRDAATLTEVVDNGRSKGTFGPGHRGRRRWQIHRPREPYSSEDEPITDGEDELEFRRRRRRDRYTPEPEYKEERRTRQHRANRCSFFQWLHTYISVSQNSPGVPLLLHVLELSQLKHS